MEDALSGPVSDVSGTKKVHEFTGTITSLRLCVITVEREIDGLETLEQADLHGGYAKHGIAMRLWLSRSRLGVLDIIQF